jgi:hypothetical protein
LFIISPFDKSLTNLPHFEVLDTWRHLLENYTRSALTKDQDILVAVSAIAKTLQTSIRAEYFAGIWSWLMPFQLIWVAREGHGPNGEIRPRRASHYTAPTWSWASVIGSTLQDFEGGSWHDWRPNFDVFEILECKVKYKTDDPFSQVSDGFLRVRGWLRDLKRFRLQRSAERNVWQLLWGGWVVNIAMDTLDVYKVEMLFFMPIVEVNAKETLTNVYRTVGLVLCKTGVEGQYSRVGRLAIVGGLLNLLRCPVARKMVDTELATSNSSSKQGLQENEQRESKENGSVSGEEGVDYDDTDEWTHTTFTIV